MPDINTLIFSPFPVLHTQRLLLRKLQIDDQEIIFQFRTNAILSKYINRPMPKNIGDARKFIENIIAGIEKNEFIYWAMTEKNKDKLIGTICIWAFSEDKYAAELGYELDLEYQKKGFMIEAFRRVEQYAFEELKLKVLKAFTHRENAASSRLLEKNNFILDMEASKKYNEEKGEEVCIYCKVKN